MLLWDKPETIEGFVTYGDDENNALYYVIPNEPRFRIASNGLPVFEFIKYRDPISRPGGKVGGGYIVFDVEVVVPDDKMQKIQSKLQERLGRPVQTGTPNYLHGTVSLQILDSSGTMVEKIRSPGSPSLYGRLITPVTVELSPQGADLLEAALQGKGGTVQVTYDVFVPVRLPPLTVKISFSAAKFMEFHQKVDINWSLYGDDEYRQSLEETFHSPEYSDVNIVPGPGTTQEVQDKVREWALRTLDDAVKRLVVGDIAPVSPDDRKLPDDIEDLWRDVTTKKIASFQNTYREGQVMEWNPKLQGTLPNITTLLDPQGQPLKWEDFAITVNLDDPFFKKLQVSARVNADFANLPIFNVVTHLQYEQELPVSFAFQNSNDILKFEPFVKNNNFKYKFRYEVNYDDSTQTYASPVIETNDQFLTINVADTGIFRVDIIAGDLNFDKPDKPKVEKAQVTLRYEDEANGVAPIDQVFTLDSAHISHHFAKAIFQPQRNPYAYQVKYFMADGKELQGALLERRSQQLVINDPFAATKLVSINAIGNLETDISTIDLNLKYEDTANQYVQERSLRLSRAVPAFEWTFPVISETAGQIVYSGVIQFKDQTFQQIPETRATTNLILVEKDRNKFLEVMVVPDLIDWTKVKFTKASLRYVDPPNGINEAKDYILRNGTTIPTWKIEIKDTSKKAYNWHASFFLNDNTRKDTPLVTTEEPTIILEVPA